MKAVMEGIDEGKIPTEDLGGSSKTSEMSEIITAKIT